MHKKIGKDCVCGYGDILADRQTHRQTDTQWNQNEVDKEIKGVDSRDKVKHNERSDQLFLEINVKKTAVYTQC